MIHHVACTIDDIFVIDVTFVLSQLPILLWNLPRDAVYV